MAICAAIFATSDTREWRFYTPDADAFQREFGEALRGLGHIPPDLQVFDDPDWKGFAEIRESVS